MTFGTLQRPLVVNYSSINVIQAGDTKQMITTGVFSSKTMHTIKRGIDINFFLAHSVYKKHR